MIKNLPKNKKNESIVYIFKQISKVALPMALQGALLSLVQLVDNLFIGHLESATDIAAGINAINNITFNISTIVIGFMAGIGIYFSQASGKNDEMLKKKLFVSKIFWTFIWASSLIIIVSIFLKDISKIWLPKDEKINRSIQSARDYGIIIFPSLLIDYSVMIFSSSFKEQKKTRLAMIVAIVAIIVNSSLNYPLMYTWGMGVKGSAIATLIARLVELFIWLIYISIIKQIFIPKIKDLSFIKWKDIFIVFPKSFWWMINGFITSLAFSLQIMFMSRLSKDAGAALNSAGVIAQIIYAFTGGYAAALSIIAMHRLAKKGTSNIKSFANKLQIISILFGVLSGLILISFSWSIYYLYPNYNKKTNDQAMIMLIAIGTTVFINLWISSLVSILKGVGFSKMVVILDGFYGWIFTLPLTILLIYLVKNDLGFGYIYWIVGFSIIFKPLIIFYFFKKKQNSFKILTIKK